MDRPTKTSNLGTSFWQIPYSTKVFVMENKVHGSFFLIRCIVSFFLSSKSFGVWRNAKSSPVLQDTASSLSELNFPNPSHLSGDGCVFVIHYHRNNFLCARLRTVKALATPRGASLWHDFAFVVSITNRFILMLLNIPARSRVDDLMVRMSASWLWVAAIFPLGWLILSNNQSIATQWVLDTCLHLDHRKRQELVVAPNLLKWSGLSHLIATRSDAILVITWFAVSDGLGLFLNVLGGFTSAWRGHVGSSSIRLVSCSCLFSSNQSTAVHSNCLLDQRTSWKEWAVSPPCHCTVRFAQFATVAQQIRHVPWFRVARVDDSSTLGLNSRFRRST